MPLCEQLYTQSDADPSDVDFDSLDGFQMTWTPELFFMVNKRGLKKNQVMEHPGWRALIQDTRLLQEFRDIIFEQARYTDGMIKDADDVGAMAFSVKSYFWQSWPFDCMLKSITLNGIDPDDTHTGKNKNKNGLIDCSLIGDKCNHD